MEAEPNNRDMKIERNAEPENIFLRWLSAQRKRAVILKNSIQILTAVVCNSG